MITAALPGRQAEGVVRECLRRTCAARMNDGSQLLPLLTADPRVSMMAEKRFDLPVQEYRGKLCGVTRHDPRIEQGRGTAGLNDGMVEEFSVRARLAHQLNSVRHQDRDGHVVEQVAANPAEQCLSQQRVVVGPRHDRVGAQIGGARQQDIGDRDVTAWALFWLCFDSVPLQVPYHAFGPRPLTVQITLHRGVDSIPAVFGLSDGPTRAGHLPEGLVQPTLEVTMVETACI